MGSVSLIIMSALFAGAAVGVVLIERYRRGVK